MDYHRFILCNTGIPMMYCLLEVVSVSPEKLTPNFADKIDWIKVIIILYYISVTVSQICFFRMKYFFTARMH